MEQRTSIDEAIGRQPAEMTAVEEVYGRVLANPLLTPFFAGIPLPCLKGHQAAFLASALGGPNRYMGRPTGAAHAGLGITNAAFDCVAQHLATTLTLLGVPTATVEQVITHIETLCADIVEA